MARSQIMSWKDIPNVVRVWDDGQEVKKQLSSRFALAIDAVATAEGDVEADIYLDAWAWGPEMERDGTPQDVARALVEELETAWPRERLAARVRTSVKAV
ncbi:MAG: virulence factor [Anaerolineae bacterium]|nr:virulence factor [Anaerolineae bacterium]